MIKSIIVAMDEAGCIGLNNQLPWRLSADLRRFKALTMGHHLIMGRKTYESIGRPLPGRPNIVITRQKDFIAPGCITSHSFTTALAIAENAGENEVFIIGGAQVFNQALPVAERIYLTLIHAIYECDVHFPPFDQSAWMIVDSTEVMNDPNFPNRYTFYSMTRS